LPIRNTERLGRPYGISHKLVWQQSSRTLCLVNMRLISQSGTGKCGPCVNRTCSLKRRSFGSPRCSLSTSIADGPETGLIDDPQQNVVASLQPPKRAKEIDVDVNMAPGINRADILRLSARELWPRPTARRGDLSPGPDRKARLGHVPPRSRRIIPFRMCAPSPPGPVVNLARNPRTVARVNWSMMTPPKDNSADALQFALRAARENEGRCPGLH